MTGPEWFNGGPGCTPPPPAGVPRPPARPGAPSLRGSCPDSPLDLGGKGEDLTLAFLGFCICMRILDAFSSTGKEHLDSYKEETVSINHSKITSLS